MCVLPMEEGETCWPKGWAEGRWAADRVASAEQVLSRFAVRLKHQIAREPPYFKGVEHLIGVRMDAGCSRDGRVSGGGGRTMKERSVDRVQAAAAEAGLAVEILTMPQSTRTAEDAAAACGCRPAQIVKSLVFEREGDGDLVLILVAGDRQADLAHAGAAVGARLKRADPNTVRDVTGFAIGGVAPLGHLTPLTVLMDPSLLDHAVVWAAAGAPNAVFSVDPKRLQEATAAILLIDQA